MTNCTGNAGIPALVVGIGRRANNGSTLHINLIEQTLACWLPDEAEGGKKPAVIWDEPHAPLWSGDVPLPEPQMTIH
jgi:hypothetical protein